MSGVHVTFVDLTDAEYDDYMAFTVPSYAGEVGAIRLYERLGFEPDEVGNGGMSMIKRLGG